MDKGFAEKNPHKTRLIEGLTHTIRQEGCGMNFSISYLKKD